MTDRERELLLANAVIDNEPHAILALIDHCTEHRSAGPQVHHMCKDCKFHLDKQRWIPLGGSGNGNKQRSIRDWCIHPILSEESTNFATGDVNRKDIECELHNKDGLCKFFQQRPRKKRARKPKEPTIEEDTQPAQNTLGMPLPMVSSGFKHPIRPIAKITELPVERFVPPANCGTAGQDLECVECGVRLYGRTVAQVCRRRAEWVLNQWNNGLEVYLLDVPVGLNPTSGIDLSDEGRY